MGNTTRNASVVSLAAVVFTLTAIIVYTQNQQKAENKDLCETVECIDQAAIILKSMDKSVDPCQDFYQYACGGWLERNPIPDTRGSQHNAYIVQENNQEILKRLLRKDDPSDRNAIKKAKMYYQACVDEETLNAKGAGPAFDVIKQLGGFPLFGTGIKEEEFDLAKYLADATVYDTPIILFYIYKDLKNVTRHMYFIAQPKLIMPDRQLYLLDQFAGIQEELRKFLREFIGLMWKNVEKENEVRPFDQEALDKAVDEVYALEKDLANIMLPQEYFFDSSQVYKRLTQRDLEDLAPDFNWRRFINTILSTVDMQATNDTLIATQAVPYLMNFTSVLKKHSIETIQNYVVMYNMVGNMNKMAKEYRDTVTSFNRIFTGATATEERWKVCLTQVTSSFPMAVGALYANAAFNEESRKQILNIADYILEAFSSGIDKLDWMDDQTKKQAKLKVSSMLPLMAYPEYILDETDPKLDEEYKYAQVEEGKLYKAAYSVLNNRKMTYLKKYPKPVDRKEWITSPAVVNALYEPAGNAFHFPAGILQSPFFDSGRPYAANFGGIGDVLAHEITHGFDTQGSNFDRYGNIRNWWTEDSQKNYDDGQQCFVDQYSKYFYKEAEQYVNAELTLGENTADNGGIKYAYEGYQLWRKENANKEFYLPGLEDLSYNQMLFISFAQAFCEADTKQAAILRLTQDPHSPGVFRIIGSLQNFDKFGEAFKCEMGKDYMYKRPNETCVLW